MRLHLAAVVLPLLAGCATSLTAIPLRGADSVSSLAQTPAGGAVLHTCHWPARKLSPNGGYLDLKPCFGISGHIQYPKFSGNQGTISGRVSASTQSGGLGHVPIKVPKTVVYFTFTYTSTSKSDTIINFYGTKTGPGDGSKIVGPFQKTQTYYGHFEIVNSRGWGQITISGTTKGNSVLGIPFPGTQIEAGKKTWLLMSTVQN